MMSDSYKRTDSGLFVPYFYTKKPKYPIAFDFFAGAGGMGCGLIQAGFEIVGANEFNEDASITYMANLGSYPINIHYIDGEQDKERLNKAVAKCYGIKNGAVTEDDLEKYAKAQKINSNNLKKIRIGKKEREQIYGSENIVRNMHCSGSGWISHHKEYPPVRNFWFGDVRKLKGKDILDALGLKEDDLDTVAGGPPCQGFSKAGKQAIDDPRNGLIYEYARLINELHPKTFIMEEVPDVANFFDPDGVPVLDKFAMILQEGGYGKYEAIKKSLLTQTNSGFVIKSNFKGNAKLSKTKNTLHKRNSNNEQQTLFPMLGEAV